MQLIFSCRQKPAKNLGQKLPKNPTKIWYAKIQKMADDGLVRVDQLEWQRCRLVGAVEIQTVRRFLMGQTPIAPNGKWQAEAQQVVHDFFKLYGTEKFNQQNVLYNWDWGIYARP